MRSQFKGHFNESEKTISELWENATFVFDANVLLNLYRYSDQGRDAFLSLLKLSGVKNRIWLPKQSAHEFLKNRLQVIGEQSKAYDETKQKIVNIKTRFEGSKGHPFVSEKTMSDLLSVLDRITTELDRNKKFQDDKITKDDLKHQIADLFDGCVGPGLCDKAMDALFEKGAARYKENIPPGYLDGSKHKNAERRADKRSNFGDFILWQQTLDFAKENNRHVILVTDDRKEDWWLKKSGKTVSPRPELIAEFADTTNQKILIYTPNRFLEVANKKLNADVSDTAIKEISAEREQRARALSLKEQAMRRAWAAERAEVVAMKEENARRSEIAQQEFEGRLSFDPSVQDIDDLIRAEISPEASSLESDTKIELNFIRGQIRDLMRRFSERTEIGDDEEINTLRAKLTYLDARRRGLERKLRDL
jgi:hypothetical protein